MSSNNRIDRVPLASSGGRIAGRTGAGSGGTAGSGAATSAALFACGFSAVGQEPDEALSSVKATTMVCLLTLEEIEMRYPDYAQWLTQQPSSAATPSSLATSSSAADQLRIWLPTTDGEITDDQAVTELVLQVVERLRDGHGVVVHCGAGMARTAVVCILTMVALGAELDDATTDFRQARPGGGPDGPAQEKQIARLAKQLG